MKRALTLLLALVLLLSAIPFAGAAFKDEKTVNATFLTAVNDMAERGIIGGFPDGSFSPRGTLTRAQAAKILCVMLEGSEKADALTKTDTGFSDVPVTHWAAKYVAYCVGKGIVAGVGGGKYDPDAKLTEAAFAKMLLVACGADGAKFTGADWAKNVEAAREAAFLDYNFENFRANRNLPRQEAAQMAWNALVLKEALDAADKKDLSRELPASVPEKIKVLAIGNSFSNDCVLYYLYELLENAGVKEITLGNMYHSGCSLQMHVDYALGGKKQYEYSKRVPGGEWVTAKESTLGQALADEDWEYVTYQHGSSKTGLEDQYHPAQDILLHYVQKQLPTACFGWNAVWAEAGHSTRQKFKDYYGGDQMKMLNMYYAATKSQVLTEPRYKFVIPTGTAIQNARTSFIGDHMDRDGYHLNKGIGRYIASMVWCCKLTGVSPDKLTYLPEKLLDYLPEGLSKDTPGMLEKLGEIARESVANALANPYEVTQSKYTTAP